MNRIILALLLAITFSFCNAQSVTIEPSKSAFQQDSTNGVHINSKESIPLKLSTEKPNMYMPFYTYNTLINKKEGEIMAGFGGLSIQGTEYLQLGTRGYVSVTIDNIGKLKVGSEFRKSGLEVYAFTKLGDDAPAIKIKRINGITRSTQGTQQAINHGLDESKILSISVMVDYESNDYIPASFKSAAGYEFEWTLFENSIIIKNITDNSANILSKPVKILITYEE